MRQFIAPLALTVALVAGGASFAATPAPAKTPPAKVSMAKMKVCAGQWKAEKKHTQSKKAFMAACEAAA